MGNGNIFIASITTNREARLHQIKLRIDGMHEGVIRALKGLDDDSMDRAMEEQRELVQECSATS